MQGKPGNFLNWRDDDNFNNCRFANGSVPVAHAVNCVLDGASSNVWGIGFTSTPDAAADLSFANQGWVAGAVYRFDIYNDDGWKTVNGQAGKTPIATYTATLAHLPYSAASLAGNGLGTELFPRWGSLSKTTAEIATAIRQKALIAIDATWSAPGTMPDTKKLGWGSVYAYDSGRANSASADFPASRNTTLVYPAQGATQARLPSPTAGSLLVTPTYSEIGLFYTTHDGNTVSSLLTFF